MDTSCLIPLVDSAHPDHQKARLELVGQPIWTVTSGVVAEATQVVRRMGNALRTDGNAAARGFIERLAQMPQFRYLAAHDGLLASRIYHNHPGLSYVDAWGIAVAIDRQEPLMTFDAHQAATYERLR